MSAIATRIAAVIASEISAKPQQVLTAIDLLDEGATVPFIARYRKEVTGGLDDTQLRNLEERLTYLRELESRRSAVLDSIREQGKLDEVLEQKIAAVMTKAELEDLYLPFKPKRRTRAEIAREKGLGPLAEALLTDRKLVPTEAAAAYLKDDVPDVKAALEGARDILMEGFAENADLLGRLREYMRRNAVMRSRVADGKENEGAKFSDYFDHTERWSNVAGHRALAMMRGRNENILMLDIEVDTEDVSPITPAEKIVAAAYELTG